MKYFVATPARRIEGRIRVPGDKSISHRALMLAALADGRGEVRGFLPGADCLATLAALEAMGVRTTRHDDTSLAIDGVGLRGLRAPAYPLDMGNSGTAMRLMTGILAGQEFDSILTGDESLSRRPMERVAQPLRLMGAGIETTAGRPPVRVSGRRSLKGIHYEMPVASAQVKSALLLAGLFARGETWVRELAATRDHTERMLRAFGQPIRREADVVKLAPEGVLRAAHVDVPGDLSSATFMMMGGILAPAGELVIDHLGLNPTRTGVLEMLRLMGADIQVEPVGESGGEPFGRIRVRPSALHGAVIPAALVPLAIDEFPAVFVAAALASGETVITGAQELRHKESDRIAVMAAGLRALGVDVIETPDGARIRGGALASGVVDSTGDHRVAMAFAAGAVRAAGPVRILDTANVATSFPGFVGLCGQVGMNVVEREDHGDVASR
jgi:3-phosphoshikimate 1-carboxyvinyltransferase